MCLIWVSKLKGTTTHQVSLSRACRISQYSRVSTIGRNLPARSVVRIAQARSCVMPDEIASQSPPAGNIVFSRRGLTDYGESDGCEDATRAQLTCSAAEPSSAGVKPLHQQTLEPERGRRSEAGQAETHIERT